MRARLNRAGLDAQPSNRLLASLSDADVSALDNLEFVTLDLDTLLVREGAIMTHVYFPVSGMISLVTQIGGIAVESATVGREGVLGLSLFLDDGRAVGDCMVQVNGEAWRLPAAAFLELAGNNLAFDTSIRQYTATRLWVSYRTAACNLMHSLPLRTARWLLLMHDHTSGDKVRLTHQYLAHMLGVRRAGVTKALGTLQRQGIITSQRGSVTIVDRQRLEAEACECESIIRARQAL